MRSKPLLLLALPEAFQFTPKQKYPVSITIITRLYYFIFVAVVAACRFQCPTKCEFQTINTLHSNSVRKKISAVRLWIGKK